MLISVLTRHSLTYLFKIWYCLVVQIAQSVFSDAFAKSSLWCSSTCAFLIVCHSAQTLGTCHSWCCTWRGGCEQCLPVKMQGSHWSCHGEIRLFQSGCWGAIAAQSKVASQMQETAGEQLQLELEVFICASSRTKWGWWVTPCNSLQLHIPFLQYLFLPPTHPSSKPKALFPSQIAAERARRKRILFPCSRHLALLGAFPPLLMLCQHPLTLWSLWVTNKISFLLDSWGRASEWLPLREKEIMAQACTTALINRILLLATRCQKCGFMLFLHSKPLLLPAVGVGRGSSSLVGSGPIHATYPGPGLGWWAPVWDFHQGQWDCFGAQVGAGSCPRLYLNNQKCDFKPVKFSCEYCWAAWARRWASSELGWFLLLVSLN